MILDNDAKLVTTVAFDLETVRPGPGKPIKMWAQIDIPGALVITMGATGAAAGACITVQVPAEGLEFEIPSNTLQYIKSTFTATAPLGVFVTMCGNQTNV